jgi:hypothetical protein
LKCLGVGIGLYFKSLKALFVVLLVCALISVVAIKENETFNPSSSEVDAYNGLTGGDVDECPVQLLGSVYGAQRDGEKECIYMTLCAMK